MDAFVRTLRSAVFLLMSPILATALAMPGTCLAGCPHTGHAWYFPFVDCSTLCGWHRTWHGPNALATPLNGYFIPRPPACCGCGGFAGRCGCGEVVAEPYTMYWPADGEQAADCCSDALAVEPPVLERLGQVPNDFELNGGHLGSHTDRPGR